MILVVLEQGLDIGMGFLQATAGEEMLESRREFMAVAVVPCENLFGDAFEGIEVGCGILVSKRVISDDLESLFEEGSEILEFVWRKCFAGHLCDRVRHRSPEFSTVWLFEIGSSIE